MTTESQLLEAARAVIAHMNGRQPVRGWLNDTKESREALASLVAAVDAAIARLGAIGADNGGEK